MGFVCFTMVFNIKLWPFVSKIPWFFFQKFSLDGLNSLRLFFYLPHYHCPKSEFIILRLISIFGHLRRCLNITVKKYFYGFRRILADYTQSDLDKIQCPYSIKAERFPALEMLKWGAVTELPSSSHNLSACQITPLHLMCQVSALVRHWPLYSHTINYQSATALYALGNG